MAHDYTYIGLHLASHAKRILELRAAHRLVLFHITCMFAYVHVRAHTCTRNCSDQTKEHTHILSGGVPTNAETKPTPLQYLHTLHTQHILLTYMHNKLNIQHPSGQCPSPSPVGRGEILFCVARD